MKACEVDWFDALFFALRFQFVKSLNQFISLKAIDYGIDASRV